MIYDRILRYLYYHVTFTYCSNCFPDTLKIKTKNPQGLKLLILCIFIVIILLLSINHHILYSKVHNCRWCTSDAQASRKVVGKHVALYSVPRVPKQYPSSIQAVPRLVAQDLHKEWPSSTSVVYKECPSSSSSVQEVAKQ